MSDRAGHERLVADLDAAARARPRAAAGRRGSATRRAASCLPRERVDRLLDPGAPFLELSPLAAARRCTTATRRARGSITGVGARRAAASA